MTLDRLFALLAFLFMAGFFAILLARVPRLDLGVAVLVGLALAGWDLWTQLGPRGRR